MYYEEVVINGVLCHRGTPDGEWIPFTAEQLTAKLEAKKPKWVEFGRTFDGLDEYRYRDDQSFTGMGLAKPGTAVEIKGKVYVIGDVNAHGGECACSGPFSEDDIVERYCPPVEQ